MKKILFSILFSIPGFLIANDDSFFYGGFHSMGPLPMISLGVRAQSGVNGFDLSAAMLPLFDEEQTFHLKGQYLLYPLKKGIYLGTGLGVYSEFQTFRDTLEALEYTLEGTLGYQWKVADKIPVFLEANAVCPLDKYTPQRPYPALSFGIGF